MATNSYVTIDMATREALMVIENNLVMAKYVNREYNSEFAVSGAKIGDTLRIRKTSQWTGRTGAAISVEDFKQTTIPLTLSNQFGVDMEVNSKDATLSLDDYRQNVLEPQVAVVANNIDLSLTNLYSTVANAVVSTGILTNFLEASALLDENGAPRDGQRSAIVDPRTQILLVTDTKGLFQSSTELDKQYKEGTMGMTAGFKFSMDQNITTHTVGSGAANTITVNGANQTGASLAVSGLTGTLNKGDVFTIAGVFAVNPVSKVSTGKLKQFVVTSTVTNSGTVSIFPAIVGTGAEKNVSALAANGAAVTVQGASGDIYRENLCFHKNAFTLASADLVMPKGVSEASRVADSQLGLSIRQVKQYDISSDKFFSRLDVLTGVAALRPEHAVRVRVKIN